MKQWTALLNEKADLLFPKPNSGTPGAPSNQMLPPGMEHCTITLLLESKWSAVFWSCCHYSE